MLTQLTRLVAAGSSRPRAASHAVGGCRRDRRARFRRSRASSRAAPDARCSAGAPTVFPIECVVRGYISGSAWKEYREHGTLAGETLARRLRESDRLEPPIFSPATKAETGHDENITDRADGRDRRATDAAASSSGCAARSTSAGATIAAAARDHHRRHQVRVRPRRDGRSCSSMKSSRRTAPASGRRTQYAPGRHAAELRQAAAARLSRWRADAPAAGTATHRRRPLPDAVVRRDQRALPAMRSAASPAPTSIVDRSSRELRARRLSLHHHRRRSSPPG